MCGRFWLGANIEDILRKYRIRNQEVNKYTKGEFYPSSNIPIIFENEERTMKFAKWGFPFDNRKGAVINARAESIKHKPMFRNSFYSTRCIIPANMFYEWKDEGNKQKNKYSIGLKDEDLFSLGGIYKLSLDENTNQQLTVVIITTESAGEMKDIHSRMPLIIKDDKMDLWLNRNSSINHIEEILISNSNNKLVIERCEAEKSKDADSEKYEQLSLF